MEAMDWIWDLIIGLIGAFIGDWLLPSAWSFTWAPVS